MPVLGETDNMTASIMDVELEQTASTLDGATSPFRCVGGLRLYRLICSCSWRGPLEGLRALLAPADPPPGPAPSG